MCKMTATLLAFLIIGDGFAFGDGETGGPPAAEEAAAEQVEAPPAPKEAAPTVPEVEEAEEVEVTLTAIASQATHHIHNKLAHLTVGFALALVLLIGVGRDASWVLPAGRVVAISGAAASVLSMFTGLRMEDAYEEWAPAMEEVLEAHEMGGIATALVWVAVAACWYWSDRAGALRTWLTVVLGLMILGVGVFGGWLAHAG